jgi:hypothetical protein
MLVAELDLGFMIEKGYWKTEDAGLLHRALAAASLYRSVQAAGQDLKAVSVAQLKVVFELKQAVEKRKKKRRR